MSENLKSLRARIAAHESWANTENRTARTAPARAALDKKFLDAAGGDPVRAAHLRKAHFARLALKSAHARSKVGGSTLTGESRSPAPDEDTPSEPGESGATV